MTEDAKSFVITIDGPAGSGKSTTSKEVASRLGFRHLDSGALYRAIALALLRASDGTLRLEGLNRSRIDDLGLEIRWGDRSPEVWIAGVPVPAEALRGRAVTGAVSAVAAVPAVREWLLEAQRSGARAPGLVADGRDMGSVVFPDADLKVFLKADPEVRARRRLLQRGRGSPTEGEVEQEAALILDRDRRDSERDVAPLKVPPDAVVIDTTHVTFEDQVSEIVRRATGLRGAS